jgi:hypothetical protein
MLPKISVVNPNLTLGICMKNKRYSLPFEMHVEMGYLL